MDKSKNNSQEWHIPNELLDIDVWKVKVAEAHRSLRSMGRLTSRLAEFDDYYLSHSGNRAAMRVRQGIGSFENFVRYYNALVQVVTSEKEIEKKIRRQGLQKAS